MNKRNFQDGRLHTPYNMKNNLFCRLMVFAKLKLDWIKHYFDSSNKDCFQISYVGAWFLLVLMKNFPGNNSDSFTQILGDLSDEQGEKFTKTWKNWHITTIWAKYWINSAFFLAYLIIENIPKSASCVTNNWNVFNINFGFCHQLSWFSIPFLCAGMI